MKKLIAIALVSAAMVSSSFAGEIEGVVKAVGPDATSIELESGEVFTPAQGVSFAEIEPAKKVRIMFADGTTEATEVMIVE